MPDYNLTGLSPRSFEQLIQSLALKLISPRTIIFGDGKDGGREATYEGKTNYSNGETPWNGYIVFQAKFCQRPTQDTKKDGDWAIEQLKKELEDFANSAKGRRKPDYYIFATNVVLTPMLDRGSKDKTYQLFEDYKNTVPLKGYDIWDYDKIARFLDDCVDIRQTYAAWITSGDVLTEVIKKINLQKSDFEKVISNFLQKELIADLYANLEQAGNSQEDKIPLASVFVDVPISNRFSNEVTRDREEVLIVARLLESAKDKLDPDSFACQEDIDTDSRFLRSRNVDGRWVVIGGPGQGKTTVSQFICQLFRVAILKNKPLVRDREVKKAISIFESQCQQEKIDLPTVKRFPLRIVLNDFAAKLASEKESIDSLLDYITDRICKRTSKKIVVEDLREWLASYPWLIILDGLDEVPASSNRRQVMNAIQDFWIDANDLNADIMVVATTRPQGYNDDFGTDIYRHVSLAPLSNNQALHYARRLVNIRYGNDSSRQEKIISRLERAAGDASTTRLMQSPLQVTILTILCDRIGQPPKDRWKLFSEYHRVIYQREVERDIPASEILREYQTDIDSIHHQVGLLLQVESERSGKTDARLSVEDFTTLVRSRLEAEGHEGNECEVLTRKIIDAAANRLVFLVGLEQKVVGFEIRSLQEFMAAEAIMNGNDEQIGQRLEEIIPIISWRNVVLFAIGKCFGFTEKQYLRDNIHTSCAALNDKDSLYTFSLAGSRLALEILEDGVVTQQPKYLKLFIRQALLLLDLPPEAVHIRLAELYSDSLKSIYKEEIEKRISNSNYQLYLGAWSCLLHLISLGCDWAIELADQYWSFTEEEQLKIITSTKININSQWSSRILLSILPSLSPRIVQEQVPWEILGKSLYLSEISWVHCISILFDYSYRHRMNDIVFLHSSHKLRLLLPVSINDCIKYKYDFSEFETISNTHPEWRFYISIFNFKKNPCSNTLATALESIANNYDLFESIKGISCSWIIRELLSVNRSKVEILEVVKKVRNGYFGDYDQWVKAEERWQSQGINKKDILHITEDGFHFDKHITSVGFPFTSCGLIVADNIENENHLLSELVSLHVGCTNNRAKNLISAMIIKIVSDVISSKDLTIESSLMYQLNKIIEWRIESDCYWNSKQLLVVDTIINDRTEKIKLINSIKKEYIKILPVFTDGHQSIYLTLFANLVDYYVSDPSLLGILNVINTVTISIILYHNHDIDVESWMLTPNLEKVYSFNHDILEYKQAQIFFILSRYGKNDFDTENTARKIIELIDNSPSLISFVFSMIENRYFTDFNSRKLLRYLQIHIPKYRWQEIKHVVATTNEFLSTKTSSLASKNKWNTLGLPSGASLLLSE